MHTTPNHTMKNLETLLSDIDGMPYGSYRQLQGKSFKDADVLLFFNHIQNSPGAYPASVCSIRLGKKDLGLISSDISNTYRVLGAKDYILRIFHAGVKECTRPNRGSHGSGSFQIPELPPQVLERNIVHFETDSITLYFRISLPGTHDNRVLAKQALDMFILELPLVIDFINVSLKNRKEAFNEHCDGVEDMLSIQKQLKDYGLSAFIADGSILPRESGISDAPLKKGAVPFCAPEDAAVVLDFPHAGNVRGLGIRRGVTTLIGGGFHGKSTLLDALVTGVYPHIPGDGRERVVTDSSAVFICAEDGRSVNGVDISGFMSNLPGGVTTRRFVTSNASGSTSQAAALIEAVLSGSRLLLIDEDSSATNFMIRDSTMRRLIPEDPIIPLFDRIRELYDDHGVSSLIVSGGSSDYVGAADHVIAMRHYHPVCMTEQAKAMGLPSPITPNSPLSLGDWRQLLPDNFNPAFTAERIGKTLPVRIKPLRLYAKILEYGDVRLDLTKLAALVDSDQVLAVGYALLLARNRFSHAYLSPTQLSRVINDLIDSEGFDILCKNDKKWLFMARPRRQELSGAINRLRHLAFRFCTPE